MAKITTCWKIMHIDLGVNTLESRIKELHETEVYTKPLDVLNVLNKLDSSYLDNNVSMVSENEIPCKWSIGLLIYMTPGEHKIINRLSETEYIILVYDLINFLE